MALIMNASAEEQQVKVRGNYFHFKPNQVKQFEENFAQFLMMERRWLGLVDLPEEFSDPTYAATEEGKRILESKRKEGVNARVTHLRSIIYNNEVSLRSDLARADMKIDPKILASTGEIKAYEELLKYQSTEEDENKARLEYIKNLEAKLKAKGT